MSASARRSTIWHPFPPAISPAPLPRFRPPHRKEVFATQGLPREIYPRDLPPRFAPMSERPPLNPMLKLALDLGPLVLFFVANARFGIFAATAAFMAAVLAALLVSYAMTRRLPVMPVVTAIVVVVFGGLTLILHDATFI